MTRVNVRRKIPGEIRVAALVPLVLVIAGCAGSGGGMAERRMDRERCIHPETLVCYGKSATKLGDRSRLEDVEFCRCERIGDIY